MNLKAQIDDEQKGEAENEVVWALRVEGYKKCEGFCEKRQSVAKNRSTGSKIRKDK